MDYYQDSLERSSHYSRERSWHGEKDRYGDFDRDLDYPPGGVYPPHPPPPPPPDDPYGRIPPRSLLPHPPRGEFAEPLPDGIVPCGSVVVYPLSPFDPKPKHRERPRVCKTVFVGSLPDSCKESHLHDVFSQCGNIHEVRVSRGRNFGHVQFSLESSVDRAMLLSGCLIKIANSSLPQDCSRIHVDYALDKAETEMKHKVQRNEALPFSPSNASMVTEDLLKMDDVFCYAAKNIITWFGKGACTQENFNMFYDLIGKVNTRSRRVVKTIQEREEDELEFRIKQKQFYEKLLGESKLVCEMFESASGAKSWNCFTKAQRKTITQWKEGALDIRERLRAKLENGSDENSEPPTKLRVIDSIGVSDAEAELERARREIEQLKTDREVAVEKKDKQILQLKTLMAKFKKACPDEWEKAIGVKTEEEDSKDNTESEAMEVIDGVSLDDLNSAMAKEGSDTSLATAAAAYAKMRNKVGSTAEISGTNLSEPEIAIVSVLAAFLTVHPLGATIEAITSYFQTFNSAYNTYFLESLLRRLTKVFQYSTGGTEGRVGKWWFLGFQTCYATPNSTESADTAPTSTTEGGATTKTEES